MSYILVSGRGFPVDPVPHLNRRSGSRAPCFTSNIRLLSAPVTRNVHTYTAHVLFRPPPWAHPLLTPDLIPSPKFHLSSLFPFSPRLPIIHSGPPSLLPSRFTHADHHRLTPSRTITSRPTPSRASPRPVPHPPRSGPVPRPHTSPAPYPAQDLLLPSRPAPPRRPSGRPRTSPACPSGTAACRPCTVHSASSRPSGRTTV